MKKEKDQEESFQVFKDLKDFFEKQNDYEYLTATVAKEDLSEILDKLSHTFESMEEYEKCQTVANWKKNLENAK